MKYFTITLVIFILSSCGYINLDLVDSSVSPITQSTPPTTPVGGSCTPLNMVELGIHPEVTGTVSGMQVVVSRTAGNSQPFEYFAELARTVQASTAYIEMTVNSFNRISANEWLSPVIAFATQDVSNYIGIRGDSDAGATATTRLVWINATNGSEASGSLIPGLDIFNSLPYTLGLRIDRTTGQVTYKDSLGNSGVVAQNANLMGAVTTGLAAGVQQLGDTLSIELNVGDRPYRLTPPANSADMCGNAL